MAVLIAALLLSVSLTAYIVLSQPHGETFTELYILGDNGKADDYPQYADLERPVEITVCVANHEYRSMDYKLLVVLEDDVHNNIQYVQNLTLADNDTWQRTITIKPMINGTQLKLDFLLYADGNMTAPYRECYLYMDVNRPWYYDVAPVRGQFKKLDRL